MSSMSGKEILIVEDAQDVRLLVRRVLESEGARVVEADSVDAGLSMAEKETPHLVILDLELPGQNGFDFLNARKEHPKVKDIPTIILSGKKDKTSVVQAIGLG